MTNLLLAESGGTKTDWCLFKAGRLELRFETQGLHPRFTSDEDWSRILELLKSKIDLENCMLDFYGAGCYNDGGRVMAENQLEKFGFKQFRVYSDLHAAGKAVGVDGAIWVAIMGTGSVLFEYADEEIIQIIGGKGHLSGDEGSGYYFGKLLWNYYEKGELTPAQQHILEKSLSTCEISETIRGGAEKVILSQLPFLLKEHMEIFANIHTENIKEFMRTHDLARHVTSREIYLAGSYAYYHRALIQSVFDDNSVKVKGIFRKPMDTLIEQIVADTY